MRREYEMTEADRLKLLGAMKPEPVMFLSGGTPMFTSLQERANNAWRELGERLGFDHMTVMPTVKGDRFFTAESKEPS